MFITILFSPYFYSVFLFTHIYDVSEFVFVDDSSFFSDEFDFVKDFDCEVVV